MKRVFLIVLDSFGIGELPDAAKFNDEGSNTLASCAKSQYFSMPNMKALGFFNIDGVEVGTKEEKPSGAFARLGEGSDGKDTTIGHWEIAGLVSEKPFPTYPDGFPEEILAEFEKRTGRKVLCNLPYSGTKVIEEYGKEHIETGALIVYTSADSVFQIAAHEEIVPIEKLYEYCEIAREILSGEHAVARVIARPFIGEPGAFTRTSRRHDYSLSPLGYTMCDALNGNGFAVKGIGKIYDIFNGVGITESERTTGNEDGINKTVQALEKDFEGLCFVNLVDYDMLYGHRNDIDGYAKALKYFDDRLPEIIAGLKEDDILMITADHGCDPGTESTDHSREYVPLVMLGAKIKAGVNLGTRDTFADIAATICDYFNVPFETKGTSFLQEIIRRD